MKNKYMFGGGIIVVFLGIMIYLLLRQVYSTKEVSIELCNLVKRLKLPEVG